MCLRSPLPRSIPSSSTPSHRQAPALLHKALLPPRGTGRVRLPGLGTASAADLHHSQRPSNLSGAKTSLPRSISLQQEKEPPVSSSLTPFILSLVSSHQPHTAAQTALAAAFMDCSAGDECTLGGIPAHPLPLMAQPVQNCPPGSRGPWPKCLNLSILWSHALGCWDSCTSLPQT